MGRSTASCFKIIACGGSTESVDRDDIDQNKGSDKRGWSFRKRSARHRVLSNTVVTEVPSSENKESSEPVILNSEAQINPNISTKVSDNQWTEEMPRLSTSITKDATVSTKAACEDDIKHESVPDESAILVIQAAVRRFLAQRELARHKNVVKLQAAVRGHLVRNHAVGTLRCVQAIVKMQALVRARRVNLSVERSCVGEKVQNPVTKPQPTYISIEKLLGNKFARQLLESTPKTKQINIKCDPSRSDSAWNWLERWMSVSSPDTLEPHDPEPEPESIPEPKPKPEPEQEKVDNMGSQIEAVVPSHCELRDMKPEVEETTLPSEGNENAENEEEKPQPANTHVPDLKEKPDPLPRESLPLNSGAQTEVNSVPQKPVLDNEPKRPAKRLATEQADSEGRKSVFGSRKASNPAFIAAQSRFEEITSKTNSLKPADSSSQDNVVEPEEYLVPQSHTSLVVPNGGSECGTELSITSTLDSSDHVEVETMKPEEELETKVLEHNKGDHNVGISKVKEKLDDDYDDEDDDVDIELEPVSGHQIYKSNTQAELEASPRSHITIPESQGTPSSQISTSTKKTRSEKKESSQKRKSWSTSNKSPSADSGLRSSLEKLPKEEPKPGKRRNSFGSPRPDQEPSNTSLPSYMQATESARAKALANSSPRSSPDVQDKDTYLKKRHSLPGAVNGRQGSPRIQRSMSQALQSTKPNSNQERKWQR